VKPCENVAFIGLTAATAVREHLRLSEMLRPYRLENTHKKGHQLISGALAPTTLTFFKHSALCTSSPQGLCTAPLILESLPTYKVLQLFDSGSLSQYPGPVFCQSQMKLSGSNCSNSPTGREVLNARALVIPPRLTVSTYKSCTYEEGTSLGTHSGARDLRKKLPRLPRGAPALPGGFPRGGRAGPALDRSSCPHETPEAAELWRVCFDARRHT
jgi:hypothetical protein